MADAGLNLIEDDDVLSEATAGVGGTPATSIHAFGYT
jgi:hypothetical protein